MDKVRDALEAAKICIAALSQRLGCELDEGGNIEPQYACEATRCCDLIEEAIAELDERQETVIKLESLDFSGNTATFSIPENSRWLAGQYACRPLPQHPFKNQGGE